MNKSEADTILKLLYSAHRFLSKLESHPRDYGTGDTLYSSDIHTIAGIADLQGCNLTRLADHLDVSKAAVSKFTAKLIRLGYIEKESVPGDGRELLFSLTPKGLDAVEAHRRFERKIFGPLQREIEGLTPAERNTISEFLERMKGVSHNLEEEYLE